MGSEGNIRTLKQNDLLSIDQINPLIISQIFNLASQFKKTPNQNLLKGKLIALLFFEPSSRTFSSFSAAIKRLGGQTIEYQNPAQTSSLVKGETFEDMIKVFSSYVDAIVIRHPEKGSAKKAAEISMVPVINAGDGVGEHPTQALLDAYTIFSHHKKLSSLKGLIVGDLVNGRTVHSLLKTLSLYKGNEIFLLSPKNLSLPKEDLARFGKEIKINLISSEDEIPKGLDFWYWTRVQQERLTKKLKIPYILRNELIEKYASPKTLFMHPLPRVGEILEEVDSDPRAMYLTDQIKNGLLVRMGIMSLILKS